MIFFVFLLFFFTPTAHAQEAVGEDTPGMRLTREPSSQQKPPAKYIPSVPDPTEQKIDPLTTSPQTAIVPLDSPGLHIDNSRLLKFLILNKQTARTEIVEVSEGGSVTYGTLTIRLVECWRSAPDTTPESAALLQIYENSSRPSYFGWMWASTPSLNPFEHASYDITVKECR